MTRQEVTAILRVLRTIWTTAEITDDTITAWTWAFDGYRYADVEVAAAAWMRTSKWFPKPAELLELIGEGSVIGSLVPEAAWGEVMREARRVGHNRIRIFENGEFRDREKPSFSHPLIEQAVEAIGWAEICTVADDDRPIVRAQFLKALKAIADRQVRQIQVGHGSGRIGSGVGLRPIGRGSQTCHDDL